MTDFEASAEPCQDALLFWGSYQVSLFQYESSKSAPFSKEVSNRTAVCAYVMYFCNPQ